MQMKENDFKNIFNVLLKNEDKGKLFRFAYRKHAVFHLCINFRVNKIIYTFNF